MSKENQTKKDNCDDWGKEFEKKAEKWAKSLEQKCNSKELEKKIEKPAEFIATMIVNIILLYIFGRIQDWLPFLTDSFAAVLPLLYISAIATIIANLLFLIIGGRQFISIVKALLNAWSIIVMITMYYVFPFDFSAYDFNWNLLVRIFLILGIFGTAIGTIVETTKGLCSIKNNK